MKTQCKKLASLFLCVCLLLSVMAVNVFAGTESAGYYEKVTTAPTDWSGDYLIVCETENVAFNGGLTTLDAANNNIAVTITDGKIEANATTNAAKMTIAKATQSEGYTIKSASGYYIGRTATSNGLNANQGTEYTHTIGLNGNGEVDVISSGGPYLRYNNDKGQYRFRYYKTSSYTSQEPIALYKYVEPAASEHTCDFATPNYDATGHWNECACGEKDAVVPHELTYVVDGDKHYQKCDCGYTTEKADHDFTEGDCVCGEQKPNTARVDEDTRIITVKAEEGYQLKAGSLIVTDANGVRYVPTRVGYRDGGDASAYEVPAEAVAPYTVDYAFVQPTGNTDAKDNSINVAYLGAQVTENAGGGLRHVHRLNISTEGGKLYLLYNGEKKEVAEYGLLLAAQAVLQNPEDLDIETAEDSMHVQQYAWPEANKYFDQCSDYVDLSDRKSTRLNSSHTS